MFVHALVGCDTTSALFGKGKKTVISLLQKNESICQSALVFYDIDRTIDELYPVAENIIKRLYVKDEQAMLPINDLRYKMFTSELAGTKKDLFTSLPPTQAALSEYVKRVYLQILQWLCNKLDPLQWGWERLQTTNFVLAPIKTSEKAAPDDLLAMVCCKCARSKCTMAMCICKKSGLHCSQLCKYCTDGDSCQNQSSGVPDEPEPVDEEMEVTEEICRNIFNFFSHESEEEGDVEEGEENEEEFLPIEFNY
ncbi:uncharacterized protein [Fopius arisanus]|uniref:Tesmin/TSO1-like CXC domain-containing protein n=1 Tax=Fopius arisanus TaxID=64838 RepID=A0A9R1TLH5_9HYME|nr:PREDICTED: uncharacterized protein LOC105271713 [Fopius arisanus]